MKNDCGGHSLLSDIQLPLTVTFYATLASRLFPLGSTWDLLCTSHAAKTSIGLHLGFRCYMRLWEGQVTATTLDPRFSLRKDFGTKGHGSSVAFRPSANLPRSFRELSAPESNFQVTYSNLFQYHYSYNAPSTVLIRWNHRGEESDQYSGGVSILGLRGLPLLQCPNPSVNPKCA